MQVRYVFLISLFLNFLKKISNINENIICFIYKSLSVCTLFFKGNMLNNFDDPKKMNDLIIPYYIYSIFNHLDFNYTNLYMVVHHLCALNFLIRPKYLSYSVNLLHGNLVLADYPNVFSEIYYLLYGKKRNHYNIIFCESFFIIHKIFIGVFNSYLLYKYYFNSKYRMECISNMKLNEDLYHIYNWDLMSSVTTCVMYIAILYKINRIFKLNNNKQIYKIYKLISCISVIVIHYNIMLSKKYRFKCLEYHK